MLTNATALKKLTSKLCFHASISQSATGLTGVNTPWLITIPSIRPNSWIVTSTAFWARARFDMSPTTTWTCWGYWTWIFSSTSSLRARTTTLCERSRRCLAMARPMPDREGELDDNNARLRRADFLPLEAPVTMIVLVDIVPWSRMSDKCVAVKWINFSARCFMVNRYRLLKRTRMVGVGASCV